MASGAFLEEMVREQSLLQATCGDLFDHIDDLLDFSKEESAADVLLLDAPPPPGSPLSARIIDAPPAVDPAPAREDLFDAAQGFTDAAGHVASVSLLSPAPFRIGGGWGVGALSLSACITESYHHQYIRYGGPGWQWGPIHLYTRRLDWGLSRFVVVRQSNYLFFSLPQPKLNVGWGPLPSSWLQI
jgi:hypothetical protein